MPKSITIRDVPDATRDELASRAALTGRSLQEYLSIQLDRLAETPDAEAWVARVRARTAVTGGSSGTTERALAMLREDRER